MYWVNQALLLFHHRSNNYWNSRVSKSMLLLPTILLLIRLYFHLLMVLPLVGLPILIHPLSISRLARSIGLIVPLLHPRGRQEEGERERGRTRRIELQ